MILHGNQRGNAKELAEHLMKAENEVVQLFELRGFMSSDLMGALNEIYAISRGTRCDQFLYSLSLNPPHGADISDEEFLRIIEEIEALLGLTGQPRAIVFHEKNGRRHCHVVWSRIDIERMKAIQMSHDREKLTAFSRELFLRYEWDMPAGLRKRGDRDPLNYTHAEYQQALRIGKTAKEIKAEIQEAWAISDDRASLEHALAERGYLLARGDTGRFVLMDMQGEVYSLPKMAGVKTKDVRARIGDESTLPSSDEVRKLVDERRKLLDAKLAETEPPEKDYTPEEALALVSRFHSAFTKQSIERLLKQHMKDAVKRAVLTTDILQSSDLVPLGEKNGHTLYTTQETLDTEKRILAMAEDMALMPVFKPDKIAVHQALFDLNKEIHDATNGAASVSAEQISALHHVTSDKNSSLY